MKHFEVTIIHGSRRSMLNVIEHNAMRATQIALGMLPDPAGSFAVICKPAKGAVNKAPALPCAA